ncbi:MAG: LTA synthase family protein [Rudaea sp.]
MSGSAEKRCIPWTITAALLALALSVLRAFYLEQYIGAYTSCHGCFLMPALGHDAWLLAAVFLLLGLATGVKPRWLRILLSVLAALTILAQAVDLSVLRLFNQRLYWADLLRFSGDIAAGWSVARAQFFSANATVYDGIAAFVIVVLVGVVAGARRSLPQARTLFLMAVAETVFGVIMLWAPLRYVHDQFAWNVIGANLPQGRAQEFSPAFAQREWRLGIAQPKICSTGTRSGRNIVIVITESLSAYQSALLGGPYDWLPRLDAIARANHYFTHFYANGFTTDGGEIAILTGRPPLIPPGTLMYAMSGFGPGEDTLPSIAHRAGYATYYFTATDLSFEDSGPWLRSLDFDGVEGNESPFYAGMPRGQFGGIEDGVLFARFEQWLERRQDPRPFVAVLLTISSHPPFVDPRTSRIDPAGSFGYVDAQLADFHDALAKRSFFANGILLITGDHRSMTPILGAEYRRFGERAFARIPLIVSGDVNMPKVVNAAFQQTDFAASLAHIMGVDYCRTAFNGIFLDVHPQPAQYVTQARGDDRNRVDVYFDDRIAGYLEDGDASRWIGPPPANASALAAWINVQRIRNTGTIPAPR